MTGEKILNYKIEGIREENEIYRSFTATHTQFAKKVLIKTLKVGFEESERERFIEEIKAFSHIQHPNIITLYDYLPTHNNFYLVFEEVQGKSLFDYVNNVSGPVPEEKTKEIFLQILDAVSYTHKNNIDGLGVSPHSISINKFEKIKLLDTFVSNTFREKSIENEDLNFLTYASPEEIKGENTNQKSDIYSLGVLLFFLVTGKNPYADKNSFDVKQSILNEDLPTPKDFYPMVSEEMITIIRNATAKNPKERYIDIAEFREALSTKKEEETYIPLASEQNNTNTEKPTPVQGVPGKFINIPLILLGIFGIVAFYMIYRYNNPSNAPQRELIITDQSYIGNKKDSVLKAHAQREYQDSIRIFVETKHRDTTTFFIHKVQPRENLESIAQRYFVTLDTLKYMNEGLTEKSKLKVLSGVKIPIWKIHKLKKEENIYNIANKYKLSAFIIRVANGIQRDDEDLFEGKDLVIPYYMKKKK